MDIYDPAQGRIAGADAPLGYVGHSAVPVSNTLVVVAGGPAAQRAVYAYGINSNTWHQLASLTNPISDNAMVMSMPFIHTVSFVANTSGPETTQFYWPMYIGTDAPAHVPLCNGAANCPDLMTSITVRA